MGTQLQRRLFTADEFHRMAEAGVREPLEKQAAAISDLDVVTAEATKTLINLADESWLEHKSKPRLRRFFDT